MKKGPELSGEAGVKAILMEMKQLHDCDVMEPKFANELSCQEKCAALQYLMFLEKETLWKGERLGLCRWAETMNLHQQRGCKHPHSHNQIGHAHVCH